MIDVFAGANFRKASTFDEASNIACRGHYEFLDAFRGIAAGLVVVYHFGHWRGIAGLATNGYLAVDFFFCLSGFVVAMAYGAERAPGLSLRAFIRLRLIRLIPLIALANLIAAAYVLIKLFIKAQHGLTGSVVIALVLGSLSLPDFHAPALIGGPQVFPLNGPQYTLLLELAVNVLWFALQRHIGLGVSLALSLVSFAYLAVYGLGGDTAADFVSGFPRVTASFGLGIAVFHIHHRCPTLLPARGAMIAFSALAIIFLAILIDPKPIGTPFVIASIAVLAPMIVLAGSFCRAPPKMRGATAFLGELSYPIYALHYPIFCWVNGLVQPHGTDRLEIDSAAYAVAVMIGSRYILTGFDRPVRRWLTRRFSGRGAVRR